MTPSVYLKPTTSIGDGVSERFLYDNRIVIWSRSSPPVNSGAAFVLNKRNKIVSPFGNMSYRLILKVRWARGTLEFTAVWFMNVQFCSMKFSWSRLFTKTACWCSQNGVGLHIVSFIPCCDKIIFGLYLRFKILTAVQMSLSAFWVVTPCELQGRYHCFGGTYCLYLQSWRQTV
jgi:hypothetical protein